MNKNGTMYLSCLYKLRKLNVIEFLILNMKAKIRKPIVILLNKKFGRISALSKFKQKTYSKAAKISKENNLILI